VGENTSVFSGSYGRLSMMASKYVSGTGCGNRNWPFPKTTYFSQVSCSNPIGPFAWSRALLNPMSLPNPNPSAS
jgi:hypothetical protein